MRKLIYLILIIGLCNIAKAQEVYNQKYDKTYDGKYVKEVRIINKYGNINIHQSATDSIIFKATVNISNYIEKIAEKQLENFNVTYLIKEDYVEALTRIPVDLKANINFRIDFDVYVPNNKIIKANNKFGDISCDSLNNHINIDLSYGNLNIKDISQMSSKNSIKLSYSKAEIGNIEDCYLESTNSKIFIQSINAIDINSKNSTYKIDSLSYFKSNSYKDYIVINKAKKITIDKADYSTFLFNTYVENANIKMVNGTIKFQQIEDFNYLKLDLLNTNIKFSTLENLEYSLVMRIKNCEYITKDFAKIIDTNPKEENGFTYITNNANNYIESKIFIKTDGGKVEIK